MNPSVIREREAAIEELGMAGDHIASILRMIADVRLAAKAAAAEKAIKAALIAVAEIDDADNAI